METSLASLSPEILALILDGNCSYLAIKLWKCGSHALNLRLASGIIHMDLKQPESAFCSKIPLMVKHLRLLRYFSASFPGEASTHPQDWSYISKSLPKSLEVLRIVCDSALHFILNCAPEWTVDVPIYLETQHSRGMSRLIDLEGLYPHLHTLEVKSSIALCPRDLPGLPSTLTHLTATLSFHEPSIKGATDFTNLISLLPASLRVLKTFIEFPEAKEASLNVISDDWARGPTHLETLHLNNDLPEHMTGLDWAPKTLTDFRFNFDCLLWSLNLARSYPPLVEYLEIPFRIETEAFRSRDTHWMAELPKHLTCLEVSNEARFEGCNFLTLPRSLRKLITRGEEFVEMTNQFDAATLSGGRMLESFWPPSLTFMRVCVPNHLMSRLEVLPRTLTELKCFCSMDYPENGVDADGNVVIEGKSLPPNLTSLTLVTPGVRVVSPFPQTLTYLEVTYGHPQALREALPAGLKHFKFRQQFDEEVSLLPRGLTFLHLTTMKAISNADLPRNLTCLVLSLGPEAVERMMKDFLFKELPETLTSLYITMPDTRFDESMFPPQQSLSQLTKLKRLTLQTAWPIPASKILPQLPRGLTSFDAPLSSLTLEDIASLPRGLRHSPPGNECIEEILRMHPKVVEHYPVGLVTHNLHKDWRLPMHERYRQEAQS